MAIGLTSGINAAIVPSTVAKSALAGLLPTNPVSAGLGVLSGLGGMFGGSKTKVSSATASSGISNFAPVNDVSYQKPFIELDNPLHIAAIGALIILAGVVYKRVK